MGLPSSCNGLQAAQSGPATNAVAPAAVVLGDIDRLAALRVQLCLRKGAIAAVAPPVGVSVPAAVCSSGGATAGSDHCESQGQKQSVFMARSSRAGHTRICQRL